MGIPEAQHLGKERSGEGRARDQGSRIAAENQENESGNASDPNYNKAVKTISGSAVTKKSALTRKPSLAHRFTHIVADELAGALLGTQGKLVRPLPEHRKKRSAPKWHE